jgi:hypothetical protein
MIHPYYSQSTGTLYGKIHSTLTVSDTLYIPRSFSKGSCRLSPTKYKSKSKVKGNSIYCYGLNRRTSTNIR